MDLGDGRLGRAGRHPAHASGPFGFAALSSKAGFYYLALACLVGGFLLCRALVRSPFGAVLRGIRENEAKTMALGYNTRLYKIAVVAVSYALGGLAGALYAPFAGFANTELLFWLLSGQVLIMVIVGGAGTLIGPVLGAAFFMLMEHQLSAWTEAWALYFGLIFIAFVLFAPQGIWGLATGRLQMGRCRQPTRGPERGAARARRRHAALRRPGRARPGRHEGRGRRGARRHRSQRRRQDDAVQRHHRHGEADRRTRSASPASAIAGLPSHQICRLGMSRTFQITVAVSRDVGARECAAGGAGAPSAALAAVRRRPDLRRGASARRCRAGAARPRRHRRPAGRAALARRPAPARGRHGDGAAAARAAARRADAGALGRGDGAGGGDAGALPEGTRA